MNKKERKAAKEKEVEASDHSPQAGKLNRKEYEAKLAKLEMELVKM